MLIISILIIIAFFSNYLKKQYTVYKFNLEQTLPLRGLLCLFVISCHLAPHFDKSFLSSDFGVMGAPSVSCFFFLSGYGLLKSIKLKGIKYFDGFFRKRINKLFIPLIAITILFVVLQTITEGFNLNYFSERLLRGSGITPNSWFVFAIIVCYIIFYISFFKGNNLLIKSIINALLTVILTISTIKLGWDIWTISLISFPLGVFISLYEHKVENYLSKYYLLFFFICTIISLYCSYGLHISKLPAWWPIFSNSFPLMVYIIFRGISLSNIKILNWIGRYSYEIYLIHGTLLYFSLNYIENPYFLSIAIILESFFLAPIIKRIYS